MDMARGQNTRPRKRLECLLTEGSEHDGGEADRVHLNA